MKWTMRFPVFFGCLLTLLFDSTATLTDDPYKILGVTRYATTQEIRKMYKQLAKEMHPDKSGNPLAGSKFVEMKQAYELLSDTERRRKYDERGITEEDVYQDNEHAAFHANLFDDIFSQHGTRFNFRENDVTFFYKLSITARQYDKTVVPRSARTPYLILFYTDWCFACIQTAPYCRKLVEYLDPLGVRFVTVNSAREPNLARRLSIHSLPGLVLVLDGNTYVYKETIRSVQKIIEFLRRVMPYNLVPRITDSTVDNFLNGWKDNRVRGLIFLPVSTIRLRYLITAFYFRDRVALGFVKSENIRSQYQVPNDMDTLLLFNENSSWPVARVSMRDISMSTLSHIILSNQYLNLPRLSSQEVLESLCPCEWNTPKKRLCVILVTEDSDAHDPHRQTFREFAQSVPYSKERVRFVYIYHNKQSEFINALIPSGGSLEPSLSIVIIWRRDTFNVKYNWLEEKWTYNASENDTAQKLENAITHLLRSTEALPYEAFVKDLFNEHATQLFGRIVNNIISFLSSVYDGLDKDQILPAVSVIGTTLFIVAIGYYMAYLMQKEEEDIQKQKKAKRESGNNNNESECTSNSYQPELKLHELRAEKYNGLVRLLKPGCRTIVLILDMQSRQQLIPPFHKAVWPFRKNKTLMFSYMLVERGLGWYKELLELSLPDYRDLNINPRNCVGTVLSLNGHRKYFCMFHAKHAESASKLKNKKRCAKHTHKDCETGAFIGFNSDTSESDEEILLQGNLLDGLPNWLDRLFEGTTQRYYINYWPEFPIK